MLIFTAFEHINSHAEKGALLKDDNEMNKVRNYQKELEKIIDIITGKAESRATDEKPMQPPRLFLHSCCAPCSSYVLEYLRMYFRITVFYYNPNISMEDEYWKRVAEQKRLIAAYNAELEQRRRTVAGGVEAGQQQRISAGNAAADSPEDRKSVV